MTPTPTFTLPEALGAFLHLDGHVAYFKGGRVVRDPARCQQLGITIDKQPANDLHYTASFSGRSDEELYYIGDRLDRTWRVDDEGWAHLLRDIGESQGEEPVALEELGEASGPITTWTAVAEANGVSVDTLARRRKEYGITLERPHFETPEAARAWYRESFGSAAKPAHPRRTPRAGRSGRQRGGKGLTLADAKARRQR